MNKHKRCIFPGALCTKSKKARCLKKFQIIISIFNILKKLIEKRELMDKHQKQKDLHCKLLILLILKQK